MENKHMERYSTMLVIREMQNKTQLEPLLECLKLKQQQL